MMRIIHKQQKLTVQHFMAIRILHSIYSLKQYHSHYVTGETKEVGHAWLKIEVDGQWYNYDPTYANVSQLDDMFLSDNQIARDCFIHDRYAHLPEAKGQQFSRI